jgi:site-specific recombinase XerD
MSNLTIDIENLKLETIKNLRNSKSINTLRAYQSDFRDFSLFCSKNGFQAMPTKPNIISLYITHLSIYSKYSTLKRRIASISIFHKNKGHYVDTKHPIIIENLIGIKRKIGSHQKGKKPLLFNDLKLLIKIINQSKEKERKKIRDKALLLIGFSGGFRRSELVDIELEDLEFVSEGVKIFVKRSKTDQSGEGMIKAIPYFDSIIFCPVRALKKWIELIEHKKGKIFNISDKNVALIIKKYAKYAGMESHNYAGHSLRSGFATSTAESGAEERNIMAMTGHKSTEMVRRYIKEANLFKNNPLNKLKI